MAVLSTATRCWSFCPTPLLLRRLPPLTFSSITRTRSGGRGTQIWKEDFNCRPRSTAILPQRGGGRAEGGHQARSSNGNFVDLEDRAGSGNSNCAPRLILYSKPGCCLCDGLKEKLQLQDGVGGAFADFQIEVRDITTNEKWWNLYQYEIPVLARLAEDGTEEALPRLSPRLSAEQVQKKIHLLLTSNS